MNRGFTVVIREQGADFHLYRPKGDCSGLLTFHESATGAVALFGRLHYQKELAARLGLGGNVRDAALALEAFRKWDDDALVQLEGDFSVAFWSRRNSKLIAGRDPQGGYPLFWTKASHDVAVSTSVFALTQMLPSVELNRAYFAKFLTLEDPRQEVLSEDCVYNKIRRVKPAHVIELDGEGVMKARRYWNWLDQMADPGTDRLGDIAPLYRQRLAAAIEQRMDGRCAAHFSGGMDSTSVALLASEIRRSRSAAHSLDLLTMVYRRLPKLATERPYIESAISVAEACNSHFLDGDQALDFGAFLDPPPHEEPYSALWRMSMDRCLLNAARDLGAKSVLTGCGADELVDAKPYYLSDLLSGGHWRSAWREAARWARARGCNAWNVLCPFGLDPLRARLRSWLGSTWCNRRAGRDGLAASQKSAWISREFVRQHVLADRLRPAAGKAKTDCQTTFLSQCVGTLTDQPGEVVRWSVAIPHGIQYSHPFQDRRVQCLALGTASRVRPEPTPHKPLLALAVGDLLPASIRRRRAKGHFDEVFYQGLSRHLPELEVLLSESTLEKLGVIDAHKLASTLEVASLGGQNVRQLMPFILSLCLDCWLASEEATSAT